jgi:hypothetical protein
MKKRPSPKRPRKPATPPAIIHAIQVYDSGKLGFPLAVFAGTGQFQDIARGDTMDGRCWGAIHGHSNYARIYRVVSIRHTLTTDAATGQVTHLKSLFVEPVVPPRADWSAASESESGR